MEEEEGKEESTKERMKVKKESPNPYKSEFLNPDERKKEVNRRNAEKYERIATELTEVTHDDDLQFEVSEGGLTFITDNELIHDIAEGQAVLTDTRLHDEWRNIMETWRGMVLERGRRTKMQTKGFTEWRPREHNTVADALCNVAQNTGTSKISVNEAAFRLLNDGHIIIHSDGGCRYDGRTAIGGVVRVFDPAAPPRDINSCETGFTYRKIMIGDMDSIQAETKALLESTRLVDYALELAADRFPA